MSAVAEQSVNADRIQICNIDHVEDVNDLDDLNLQSLFLEPTPIVSFDAINLKQLITLQHADPSIKHYFNLTTDPDTEGTYFFLDGELLNRKWRNPNTPPDIAECIIQILVPKCLQSRLLEIAHSISAAGHLGVPKLFVV